MSILVADCCCCTAINPAQPSILHGHSLGMGRIHVMYHGHHCGNQWGHPGLFSPEYPPTAFTLSADPSEHTSKATIQLLQSLSCHHTTAARHALQSSSSCWCDVIVSHGPLPALHTHHCPNVIDATTTELPLHVGGVSP